MIRYHPSTERGSAVGQGARGRFMGRQPRIRERGVHRVFPQAEDGIQRAASVGSKFGRPYGTGDGEGLQIPATNRQAILTTTLRDGDRRRPRTAGDESPGHSRHVRPERRPPATNRRVVFPMSRRDKGWRRSRTLGSESTGWSRVPKGTKMVEGHRKDGPSKLPRRGASIVARRFIAGSTGEHQQAESRRDD
jgi:hypothetical protein